MQANQTGKQQQKRVFKAAACGFGGAMDVKNTISTGVLIMFLIKLATLVAFFIALASHLYVG